MRMDGAGQFRRLRYCEMMSATCVAAIEEATESYRVDAQFYEKL
jgi:hypothetical protein